MVYIDRYGRVHNDPPFFYKLTQIFWGVLNFFYAFFITMFPALEERSRKSGGGGSGNGRGPPDDPRRPGRVHTLPPPPCGPSGG